MLDKLTYQLSSGVTIEADNQKIVVRDDKLQDSTVYNRCSSSPTYRALSHLVSLLEMSQQAETSKSYEVHGFGTVYAKDQRTAEFVARLLHNAASQLPAFRFEPSPLALKARLTNLLLSIDGPMSTAECRDLKNEIGEIIKNLPE